MPVRAFGLVVLTLILLAGCASVPEPKEEALAVAALKSPEGEVRGVARLVATANRIELRVDAIGLTPGEHGIHIHAVGQCDGPGFVSAGPHLNPHGKQHGSQNPLGPHIGDLPNLVADNTGSAIFAAPASGTPTDLDSQIFDADNSALIIHADPDDNRTDPTGKSGVRIACGVFERAR